MDSPRKIPGRRLFSGLAGSPLSRVTEVAPAPTPTRRPVGRPRGSRTAAQRKRDWRVKKKLQAEEIKKFEAEENKGCSIPWRLVHTGFSSQEIGAIEDRRFGENANDGIRRVKPKGASPEIPEDRNLRRIEHENKFAGKIHFSKAWLNGGPNREIDRELFMAEATYIFVAEEAGAWSPAEGVGPFSGWVCHAEDCRQAFSTKRIAADHLLQEHKIWLEKEFKRYFRRRRKKFKEAQLRAQRDGNSTSKIVSIESSIT